MNDGFDAVIVGAGIVGVAVARELAGRGLQVAVVERHRIAGGATGAGMGHIAVLDDSQAQLALTHFSQMLWRQLAEELPEDAGFAERGTIWLASNEEQMQEARRKKRTFDAYGIHAEILDAELLAGAEPNLARTLVGGLLVPSDAVVDGARATEWMMVEALRAGATLYLPRKATQAGRGRVALDNGTVLQTERIVLAGGTDGLELAPELPFRKRKGHLVMAECPPGFVQHRLVELGYMKSAHAVRDDSIAFNVQPGGDGQVLIGSSRQHDAPEAGVEERVLAEMLRRAEVFLPGVSGFGITRAWTGFRAATEDGVPLIGPWGNDRTLFVANGHEGLGITTSLATARLLADQMLGKDPPLDITPYLPSRFAAARKQTKHKGMQ
jgi:glycine/D-amino acid oxidase-like deaminating enzyme